ncbi:hypothetical protein [Fluviispira multicolorata]|uniref:Uncharacterized protein n=1 Tax=Fluviispira multicolorata TaxID=2654512 RepID=A0A833JC43_9BACT|nr:hypothetical protein [Fluviispira multicolorata]KAB8029961.1 hypothetical protein GCL57_10520 [Fluviispira multicolorata]
MIKKYIFAVSLVSTTFCFAESLPQGSYETELMSSQHGQPKIVVKENNNVEVYLDNRCRFNQFGEIALCTRNLIIPELTKASHVYSSADGVKKIYKLGHTHYSVVTNKDQPNRFLVQDNEGNIVYSLPLTKN